MIRHRIAPARLGTALLLTLLLMLVAPAAFAGNGEALTRFVPDDTKAVLSVDVERLRSSGALNTLLSSTGADAKLQGVMGQLDQVGFKPREQIDTAMIVVNGFDNKTRPLLIFEGSFPRAAIEAALDTEATATRSTVGQVPVYTLGARGSLAFLAPGIAAMGPTPLVQAAAAIAAGQARSAPSRTLTREIGRADSSRNLWFAGMPPAEHLRDTPIAGARAIRGGADITGNLTLAVDAVMPSESAANTAAQSANAQIAQVAQRDDIAALGLSPIVQGARVEQRADTLHLTLNLDQARFRRLLTTLSTVIRDQLR